VEIIAWLARINGKRVDPKSINVETNILKSPLRRFGWLITGWVDGGESLLRALLGVGEEGNE
jgi:hypothetical protein